MPSKEALEALRATTAGYVARAQPVVKKKVVKKKPKPKPPRDREDTAAAAKAGATPYTPERPSHEYDVPKPTKAEGKANVRAAERARKKKAASLAALRKSLDDDASVWAATQTITPAELNLHPPKAPPKARTWKQIKAQERKDFAALRKEVEADLPEGYELDDKAWKAYVQKASIKKPSVVWTGDPEDLVTPPLTWQQEMRLAQKTREARADLAQDALTGGKAREKFIEGLTPAERKALIKSRRPFPAAAEPWEPNLSPFAARIPGAREAMQASHWAEGLLGREGAVIKGVMASPGLAWAARNRARDLGVALGADDPMFGAKAGWAVRNKAQDVGRALERGTEAAAKYVVSDTKEGFTPSQLAKDVRDVADIARQTYNFLDPTNIGPVDEAAWAAYRGVFEKAPTALLVWMQNQESLTNTTPAQKARNREELKHILTEGRGAEAARELIIGPALSQHMIDGGPMSPMAMLELAMLVAPGIGFTPMRPAVAGTRAAIKGVRAIPQGGRHAVGEAAKEWNRIVPVRGLDLASEAGGVRVGWLGGVKPEPAWRTPFSDQLGLKGVAAKSNFGRRVESLVLDPVRAATGRKTAYAAHQQKRSEGIQRKIVGWPGQLLERAAKGMSLEESYAIRALAAGMHPLERAAKHREWALEATDPMRMYAHGVHAELNEKAAKYVMEGPPNAEGQPTVILRPSAPGRLEQTWEYYQKAYAQREDILTSMNELQQETVDNRIQASGKLFKGGEWVASEDWVKLQLQTSEARGHIVEAVNKLVDLGRAEQKDIDLWMEVVDGQARSWASRETRRLRAKASYLRGRIKKTEGDRQIEYLAQLEDVNEQLANGINPDAYFDDLDRVITGPGQALLPAIFGADHDTISFFAALKHWSDEVVDKRLASKLDAKKFHQGRTANPTIRRKGMTIGGKTTTKGWLQAVGKIMGREEILYWRRWYDDFGGAFAVFGDDAEAIMRGFAASQANQSPAGGVMSVLKVMDRLRRGEKVSSEGIGMVAAAVKQAVEGSEVEKGVAAKLSDFADALAKRETRTWMGGRGEGGAPAPADVWAARDLGYIDKKHAKRLVKEFGLVEGVDFVVDSPGAPSGLRYERISEQYQEIAKYLNAMDEGKGYLGVNDWTPAQVQAVGWAKAQKMVGVEPEDLAFALMRNTRSIDFEITQGPLHLGGNLSPEQVHAVAEAIVPEIRRLIEDSPGIYFRDMKLGISGWAEGQNGSIHIDVMGSERDIQNMLSRFARAFDQEYVQASREITRAGSKAALTIGSESFADETVKVAFFKRLAELSPEIPVLDDAGNRVKEGGKLVKEAELQGYQPRDFIRDDGSALPGIAIRTGRPYVSPKTARRFADRFEAAVTQVADEMGIDVDLGVSNIELLIGSQHGEATRFARAGSTGGLSSLDDPLEAATRKRLAETLDSVRRGERPGATDHHRYLAANRESELGVPHAVGDSLDEIIEYMQAVPPDPEGRPRWLYRAVSEEEWTAIKESGTTTDEGVVTALNDPRFNIPGEGDGRIIRIKYRDEDGWALVDDGYKAQKPVPFEAIDMVSPKLRDEGGTVRAVARDAPEPSLMAGRPTRYRVLNDQGEVLYSVFSREEAEAAIEQLKKMYGEEWEYTIKEVEDVPDNRWFGGGRGTGHAASYGPAHPSAISPAVREAQLQGKQPIGGALVPSELVHARGPSRGKQRSFIILSERYGTGYTVGHEFFHYLETQLRPKQLADLKEAVGDHPEDIVFAWTTWALMGGGGKLKPIFQQLSDSVISDLAEMNYSSANANAIPRHIIELLDTLHNWDELEGGAIRILDEEGLPSAVTHTAGVAKEPFYPGMPVSLRNKLWDFFKYSRQQSMSISGRGPIGKQWSDPTVKKQLKGHLLKSGLFEADVIRGGLREYFKALKLDSTARVRATLIKAARDLPNGGRKPSAATDYAIKINPDKTTSKELSKFFDLIADIDAGETLESAIRKRGARGALTRRMKLNELEQTHEDAINGAIEQLFPHQVDGIEIKKVAAEMMDGNRGEIPNILWVPRELVEKSGIFEPPWLHVAKRASASLPVKALSGGADVINDMFRVSLLLANPAYYPMNLIGNVVMNLIQQGPFALYNLPRAFFLSRSLAKDNAFFIDNLMGEGWIGAAEIKSGLLKGKISIGLTNVANMLVDRIPRRAAWLHEAMRAGYRSGEDLDNLIAAALRGDAHAREQIELITRAALDEMVDFENLSAIERGLVTRIIFVYPWLKGSTVWAKNFLLNHPVQAAAYAFLYERQQAMAKDEIGDRPQYLDLYFPFPSWFPGPHEVERYGETYPYGFSLRQLFTMSTTYDIFNAFYGYARGDMASSPLTEYLQPLYGAALSSMTGYDPFLDKKTDKGLGALFENIGRNLTVDSPGWNNVWDKIFAQSEEDRRRHAESGRLYPRNRMDDIWHAVFGGLAATPVNPKTANERSREGKAASSEDKTTEWAEEMKELTGHSVPVMYVAAYASKLRYEEIQKEIRHEEGTSDLSPWKLTEAKMRTYLEAHPEKEFRRVAMTTAILNEDIEELDEWDDEFSEGLDWDDLNDYLAEAKEYEEPERAPGTKKP